MNAPKFLRNEGGEINDWIEEHDRLETTAHTFAFSEKNQRDWWKMNHEIRLYFRETEKEIVKANEVGIIFSKSALRWSTIAKVLRCNRATLQHPARKEWVTKIRKRLLNKIQQQVEPDTKNNISQNQAFQVEQLKEQLKKSRDHVAELFIEIENLREEIRLLHRRLE